MYKPKNDRLSIPTLGNIENISHCQLVELYRPHVMPHTKKVTEAGNKKYKAAEDGGGKNTHQTRLVALHSNSPPKKRKRKKKKKKGRSKQQAESSNRKWGVVGWGGVGGCMIEAESLKFEFCQVIDPVGELAALRALNLFDVGEDFGRLFFQR